MQHSSAPTRHAAAVPSQIVRGILDAISQGAFWVIVAVVAIVAYLVLIPLGFLIVGTFADEHGAFTLSGFWRAYVEDPYVATMMLNSVVFALGSAALAISIGTALAFVQMRTDIPLKGLMFAASIVPLVLPAVLYAFAWLLLADPNIGILNGVMNWLGLPAFNILSLGGMIWVEGIHLSPIAFLLMVAAFRSMDPSLDESALVSGASRFKVFWRINLPLLRPALTSAVLLIFVLVLESFEIPAVLGLQSGIFVFTSRIYSALNEYPIDYGVAGAYSVGLLVIAAAGIFISGRLSRNAKEYQTVTGKAFRPKVIGLGRWRPVFACGIAAYFIVAVALPLAVLVYASLLPFYMQPSAAAFAAMSFGNYISVFSLSVAANAFKNSVLLAMASATAVMLLMTVAAWLVTRTQLAGRSLLDLLTFSPLIVPGLVLGISLSYVYLRVPLPIYGTVWILFIAYTTKYLPYGMRYASAAMTQVSSELEESASVSGASWSQTLRRVLVPLASGGILAGWMYIVIVSFRELSSSILLYSPGSEVLSVLIWDQFNNGRFTTVAAIGVLMIVFLITLVMVARRLGAGFGIEEAKNA